MFQLNPLHLPNAWWQHLLILLVPAVIGYLIGWRNGNRRITNLESRLAQVGISLKECRDAMARLAGTAKKHFDDFKVIEGIGPQIERSLHQAGIQTYAQLSQTTAERLKELLLANGSRFQMADPASWPRQAMLAASGQWAQLKQWQDQLIGGRLS